MKIGLVLTLGAAVGLVLLPSCSSEPDGPTAGILTVTLTTPNSDDGAMLFTLSGGPVDSVEAVGYSVYSARIDGNTLRVIVTGTLGPGPVARIRIPDQRQISGYLAIVNQVAAHTTYQQRDPSGYQLALAP
jgi:hypothetical protein